MAAGRWLRSEWLAVRVQIGLGAIFLYAAWPKLVDPPALAKNIWAYDIVPHGLINIQALWMPGIELVVGLALVLGIWRRAAAGITIGLLTLFIVALSWALLEANPVNCSCFDLNAAAKTPEELLAEMRGVIWRDVGMLALAFHAWCYAPRGRRGEQSSKCRVGPGE